MTTFVDILRECDTDPALDDDHITDLVIAQLQGMGDVGWALARMPIRHEVGLKRRDPVRRTERVIGASFRPGDGTMPATDHVRKLSLDQLREFRGQPIKIPGNGTKPAEDVTVEEWGIRMAALKEHAADTLATVATYRSVVNTLRALRADSIAEALQPERKRKAA